MMGLIQHGAGGGHLRVFEDGLPTHFLVLTPLSHARAVGLPCGMGDVIGKAAEPLAKRKYPQALPLTCPVQEGVELGA